MIEIKLNDGSIFMTHDAESAKKMLDAFTENKIVRRVLNRATAKPHSKKRWKKEELEILRNNDFNVDKTAKDLNRTRASVATMRWKIKNGYKETRKSRVTKFDVTWTEAEKNLLKQFKTRKELVNSSVFKLLLKTHTAGAIATRWYLINK